MRPGVRNLSDGPFERSVWAKDARKREGQALQIVIQPSKKMVVRKIQPLKLTPWDMWVLQPYQNTAWGFCHDKNCEICRDWGF